VDIVAEWVGLTVSRQNRDGQKRDSQNRLGLGVRVRVSLSLYPTPAILSSPLIHCPGFDM